MGVNVRVDGLMLATAVAVGVGVVLYKKRELFDPTSDKNLAYQGANSMIGENGVATAGDYIYGAFNLINPWADPVRKAYAKQVYFGE